MPVNLLSACLFPGAGWLHLHAGIVDSGDLLSVSRSAVLSQSFVLHRYCPPIPVTNATNLDFQLMTIYNQLSVFNYKAHEES